MSIQFVVFTLKKRPHSCPKENLQKSAQDVKTKSTHECQEVSKEKGKNDGDKELLYYPARKLHKKTIQKSQKNNQILKKTNISIFSALSLCIPLYYARVRQVLSFIKTKQVQENRK